MNLSEAAKAMDTFLGTGEEGSQSMYPINLDNELEIQAAHTYIDTIYMHKGSSIRLTLPDIQTSEALSSVASYQRWYSFRTDKTFRTRNTGPNEVWDLLTPLESYSVKTTSNGWQTIDPTVYRFANGYVGNPVATLNGSYLYTNSAVEMNFYYPTNDQFTNWFGLTNQASNDYYIVACDVSCYTDYTKDFDISTSGSSTFYPSSNSDGEIYEPTLSHRVLFYIVGVDDRTTTSDHWKWYNQLTTPAYQGGTANGNYLEEYDITFPYTRVSNHTLDLVALSKNAGSYAIPDISDDTKQLDVTLGTNGAGITLQNATVSDEDRVIQFRYPNSRADGTWYVDGNGNGDSKATILVTKKVGGTTYNIAKYNLNFLKGTQMLSQQQVADIEDKNKVDGKYWNFAYRTPDYLRENYQLLTSLTWDYSDDVADQYGKENYYPFPLDWTSSSYAFYDGSTDDDKAYKGQHEYPLWGYYGILKEYVEVEEKWDGCDDNPPSELGKEASTYHMYIDVSDRPGTIARIPFQEELCVGSELFVSAWVKSAGGSNNNDAGMLFTIMGVTKDGTGETTYTPIYRYSTGQIRTSYLLSDAIPGCGANTNQWFQVYFSFINEQARDFNGGYILQVDNNSASTDGGDVYIDDVKIYMARVEAEVEQLDPSCIGELTSLRMVLDWDRLQSRTGGAAQTLRFCFVDKLGYDAAIRENTSSLEAITNNLVPFLWEETGSVELTEGQLSYESKYESNDLYNTSAPGSNNKKFYRFDNEGSPSLAVDLWSSGLIPTRRYYLAIALGEDEPFQIASEANPCAISTDFGVTAATLIKMNGEILRPQTEFCVGQVFNFTAQLTIKDGTEEGTPVTTPIYFDWFFGSVDEYLREDPTYGVSLDEALSALRDIEAYRDIEQITDDVRPEGELTENMIALLKAESTIPIVEGGLNPSLVLHKQDLNVTLLVSGLNMVLRPIQTTVTDINGRPVEDTQICWSYLPLTLETSEESPHVHTGFWYMGYPENYEAAVRIGYRQITEEENLLIDLRITNYVDDNATGLEIIRTHENQGQYAGVDLTRIYLVNTNDPELKKFIGSDFSRTDLPIGSLESIKMDPTNRMKAVATVKFDYDLTTETEQGTFSFKPREGYEYTFNMYAQEYIPGTEISSACYASIPITLKIVPEYLTWKGTAVDNWNNDSYWMRSDKKDLHKENDSDYKENADMGYAEANVHGGYVPMLFSKITMPQDSKIELYPAGYTTTASQGGWEIDRPGHIGEPTPNIQYDMMAYKHTGQSNTDYVGMLKTERYRVALCDEIHFEPGAEMLYAEYLLYNKAWVDYELDGDRWHLLASPLQGVVAGDFYAPTSGRQATEYFQPIHFEANNGYSRFHPSVYQRGWENSTTEVNLYTDDASNPKSVAISGNWSSLYNDVTENYDPGTGFSLKVLDLDAQQALFRLPKADVSYSYYKKGSTSGSNPTLISRTDENGNDVSGRLKSDTIYHRTETDISYSGKVQHDEITVELSESANDGYYLVGNPFMAHLNMKAFFKRNGAENENGILENKYWYVAEDGVQNVVVTDPDDENTTWTNADENSLIPPLRSFFVKKKDGANGTTITFTHDMQALGGTSADAGTASGQALLITATTQDGRISRAAVAYSGMASDDYRSGEDAELFLDSNLGDVPMVYTVAGTMATSINTRTACERVPLGVYGARDEEVTLRFEGTGAFSGLTLYDARTGQATALRESTELRVATNDYGRYYLIGGVPTGTESIRPGNDIEIYSIRPGEIVVTTTGSPLRTVCVYGVNGALVARQSLANQSVYRLVVPGNALYMIYAEDAEGIIRNVKMRVR
ncbi:MAG TPA: hypothetical protein H9848_09425 [Candidatus Parabacteroides intestinigallinarum]|uniref:Uncharacterized protein n=1 Tax=Candidatus Parabacteroides intestinigallinarum TaxID=2838722 RepID=A0A9D1XSG7_9BACT|nr:hypothetical protein [Candidatus Parabacteroides intestinigallinarum]